MKKTKKNVLCNKGFQLKSYVFRGRVFLCDGQKGHKGKHFVVFEWERFK